MGNEQSKRVIVLLSIVERGKAKKLMKTLKNHNIGMHYQCVGFGTAPTEMMDIFGIGSRDKDIIISFAAERVAIDMMMNFGNIFNSYSEYGGLMLVIQISALNRLVAEILNHNISEDMVKGASVMKNEHKHNLLMITVGQGYADQVMETAKKAGATGGTVIRGRLAGSEKLEEFIKDEIEEEREIILIMASEKISAGIMESVNKEFGLRTEARGILCSVPIEKAYKI